MYVILLFFSPIWFVQTLIKMCLNTFDSDIKCDTIQVSIVIFLYVRCTLDEFVCFFNSLFISMRACYVKLPVLWRSNKYNNTIDDTLYLSIFYYI